MLTVTTISAVLPARLKILIRHIRFRDWTVKKDDAGAIVGFVDGDVTGCYFIDEGLSGISGMNLEGRAEAVKPDDMTTSDGSFPSRMPLLDNGNFLYGGRR